MLLRIEKEKNAKKTNYADRLIEHANNIVIKKRNLFWARKVLQDKKKSGQKAVLDRTIRSLVEEERERQQDHQQGRATLRRWQQQAIRKEMSSLKPLLQEDGKAQNQDQEIAQRIFFKNKC